MCESTGHAGCELAALQDDYPSWVITDGVPLESGAAPIAAEAERDGVTMRITGPERFRDLRHWLIRQEHGSE